MEKNNSTISISIPNPLVGIERIKNAILHSSVNFYNGPVKQAVGPSKNIFKSLKNPFKNFQLPKFKFNFNKKFLIKLALPVFVVLIFILGAVSLLRSFNSTTANPNSEIDSNVVLPDAVAKKDLNKTFTFPIRDEEGKAVGNFNYTIQNVELRKQIIVKGQRATSVSGRIFLIVNIKVTNDLSQEIEIPSRGYLRIIVNNNNELLAADIHNDPIEVLGKATKYTRIGIAINEQDSKKPIVLQVGEIDGKKENLEINF